MRRPRPRRQPQTPHNAAGDRRAHRRRDLQGDLPRRVRAQLRRPRLLLPADQGAHDGRRQRQHGRQRDHHGPRRAAERRAADDDAGGGGQDERAGDCVYAGAVEGGGQSSYEDGCVGAERVRSMARRLRFGFGKDKDRNLIRIRRIYYPEKHFASLAAIYDDNKSLSLILTAYKCN
jgi:hypothetical protein